MWISRLGTYVIRVETVVQVDLNADTGLIQFRTLIGDREAGYTSFEFDKKT